MPAVARDFHRPIPDIAFTITATLAMRPVGALIFGWIADRYGRRIPLMVDVVFYSVVEVLSGLAPSYRWFLFLRALYGIGMGGEWGVGASLAMETVPAAMARILLRPAAGGLRGRLPAGGGRVLLRFSALRMARDVLPRRRPGAADALHPRQSAGVRGGKRTRPTGAIRRAIRAQLEILPLPGALMTTMNFVSHGTQDMYPTFLQMTRGFDTRTVATSRSSIMSARCSAASPSAISPTDRHGAARW